MRRWTRRIALALVGIVTLALLVGAGSEAFIRRRVATAFPMAGRLIDVGGRHIQLDCRGSGAPTVVLESGLDVLGSLAWASVHDSLAATTRTCAYSRAGILWSDPSHRPFSAAGVVADLHEALRVAEERAPFVLVAHSIGGLYATEFVKRHRAEVGGLVLVDASHPDQVARLEAVTGVGMLPASGAASFGARIARTGILRMLPPSADPNTAPAIVRTMADAHLPLSLTGLAAELRGLRTTFDDARAVRALGDLPLAVLTAGAPTPPATLHLMGMNADQAARMQTEWIAMQEERAAWSTNGRHRVIGDAGHYVQFDRPDVVVDAVRHVVKQSQGITHSTQR
jgi:pimeloyl-ACP methyl ester carboxylesterase